MLEDTLVVWGGEFGRTPFFQGTVDEKAGRDHNPWGFTMLMAGGGVKGGQTIGTPTSSACARSRNRITSTTSTPRSSICWASIT